MKSGLGISDPRAMIACFAACSSYEFLCKRESQWEITGMTSFPIPSAGIRPILIDFLAAVEKDLIGSLNIEDDNKHSVACLTHWQRNHV